MPKLLQFPTAMLNGFIKKAAYYLPTEHRGPIMAMTKNKNNPIYEKTKLLITALLAAKQMDHDEEFTKEVNEAFSLFTLNEHEFHLFDGFLGAKQSMLLEFAKKGISVERLNIMRQQLLLCKK